MTHMCKNFGMLGDCVHGQGMMNPRHQSLRVYLQLFCMMRVRYVLKSSVPGCP